MEEIYANMKPPKAADPKLFRNQTGPRSSQRSFHSVILCLGLLSVFLLLGLIVLGVHYRDSAADLSSIKQNLTERLQASNDQLSFMTEERDQLNASLTEMTKERDRLQTLSKQKKTCPAGWKMFSCSCYLLSQESGSWNKGREDCRSKGADLVVINSAEEQTFLSTFANKPTWIGLNDIQTEGTWMWVDGTPLTLSYWNTNQPDNGGGNDQWGEEDCAHIRMDDNTLWNDLSCTSSLQWICEKQP
ncbi:CD209 antigen-like protein A isoform X5 [Acanthochromis polyacanthus]|uniref:CD209 antigen-like protein A isoform X5 n=1 Tax=Acanthochromis polyacanthus TaxID=80966 RepID=UPI0022345210|nr:CD209 antigen-like protein A isoform X5 [Acanthochromis polyacanthus]